MPRLPVVTGRDLIRALGKIGYQPLRQRGSHVILLNQEAERTVPVAVHGNRPLPSGTLVAILREVGLSADELRRLLG